MKKRIFLVLTTLILICSLGTRALAHEVPDMTRQGSIEITLSYNGAAVPGGTLSIFRVGRIIEDNGNYSFVLTDAYSECGVSLEDIQDVELAAKLAAYTVEKDFSGVTGDIDDAGHVRFRNLELGLYLCIQNEASEGYEKVKPFLVAVPGMKNGVYVYAVDASPKVGTITETPETEPTVPSPTGPSNDELPQTGQLNWPVGVMTASGMCLLLTGWVLRLRSRK